MKVESNGRRLRVRVSDDQAMIAFPVLGTMGIGFEVEDEDPNRHLPCPCKAEIIFDHISKNARGASRETCLEAIRLLQEKIYERGYVTRFSPEQQEAWDKEQEQIKKVVEGMFGGEAE